MSKWLLLFLIPLTGCFQIFNNGDDDEELHTVPVTNNPHVVPNHGSGFPMMGGKG